MPRTTTKEGRRRFGAALKVARLGAGLTQEDFSVVSSRTYVSTVERGQNSPTIEKVEQLALAIGVHPGSLILLPYFLELTESRRKELWARIAAEIQGLQNGVPGSRVRRKAR